MKTYSVTLSRSVFDILQVDVEANSEEEARKAALDVADDESAWSPCRTEIVSKVFSLEPPVLAAYDVLMTRDCTESAVVRVAGTSKEDAADTAMVKALDGEVEWTQNDIGHAPPYLGDCVENDVTEVSDEVQS